MWNYHIDGYMCTASLYMDMITITVVGIADHSSRTALALLLLPLEDGVLPCLPYDCS